MPFPPPVDPAPADPRPDGPLRAVLTRALDAAASRSPLRRPARTEPGEPLTTPDGVRLSTRHDPPSGGATDPDLCFVVAHGFTGSWRRPDIARIAGLLRATGGVLTFDFRGHGLSTGWSTVGDLEVLDLAVVVARARALGYRRVVTVGWSMGAAVALVHAAGVLRTPWSGASGLPVGALPADDAVDAVVAVSGPGRWHYRGSRAMRRAHRAFGSRLGRAVVHGALGARLTGTDWDPGPEPPDAVAARVAPTPLLVVHGDADHYFPVDHARWLARAAGPTATLWVEPRFGHAEAAASPDLVRRIAAWAREATADPAAGDGRGTGEGPSSARMPA